MPKKNEWLQEDNLIQLEGWARDGLTDDQIIKRMGIAKSTFYKWKVDFSEFSDAIKKGRRPVIEEVETSIYKAAQGYFIEEEETEIIESPDGSKRKKIRRYKRWMRPEVAAQIYILNNQKKEKWSNNPTPDFAGTTTYEDDALTKALKEEAERMNNADKQ